LNNCVNLLSLINKRIKYKNPNTNNTPFIPVITFENIFNFSKSNFSSSFNFSPPDNFNLFPLLVPIALPETELASPTVF